MTSEITRKKSGGLLVILVAVFMIFACGCGRNGQPAVDDTAATVINVRAVAVSNRVFENRLTVQGTIEAKQYANVSARVGGNLDMLWVDEGDVVEAGVTRLFQIDPVTLSNAVLVAERNLEVATAGLEVARASKDAALAEGDKAALDFARYERLRKENKVSDNEYEMADTRNRQARARVAVAGAQEGLAQSQVDQVAAALAIARKNLEDSLVYAPISGVVSRRLAEPGEQMAVGQTILTIFAPDSIEAVAYLPAQYYNAVEPEHTRFRLTMEGREIGLYPVYYRSPTINQQLRTFEIKGRVADGKNEMAPGSMAELTLVFESRTGLAVPAEAVLTRAGADVVFVAQDGKAVLTPVTVGFLNDGWREITSGLESGALVIYEGQTQLRNQVPVEVR